MADKYHFIDSSVLSSTLTDNNYPPKAGCLLSDNGSWLLVHGNSNDLEAAFDGYLIASPPAFMTGTINLTKAEAKVIRENPLFITVNYDVDGNVIA